MKLREAVDAMRSMEKITKRNSESLKRAEDAVRALFEDKEGNKPDRGKLETAYQQALLAGNFEQAKVVAWYADRFSYISGQWYERRKVMADAVKIKAKAKAPVGAATPM